MFKDRKDAGRQLAKALAAYQQCDGLVLGIPRGGVEVAFYVAEALQLPLSVIVVRKLPLPENPEAGFGAIAEDGSVFYQTRLVRMLREETVGRILAEQRQEIQRRIQVFRGGRPLPHLAGKTVILVDDGIAMGSTLQAAIRMCKNQNAAKIVAAAPVAGPDSAAEVAVQVDNAVILETPDDFYAVAQAYKIWYDVPDDEVRQILHKAQRAGPGQPDTKDPLHESKDT